MSDIDFSEAESFEEKAILKQMKAKSNTGLAESIANKDQANKKAMEKLFTKMEEGKISSKPVTDPTPPAKRLDEEAPAVRATEVVRVTQQINRPVPPVYGPVNAENEPVSIAWRPTTVQQLVALYPHAHAVSDLYQVLHSATQQPGLSCALIAPHGTKYLVRADETGMLYMADPNSYPAAFANI